MDGPCASVAGATRSSARSILPFLFVAALAVTKPAAAPAGDPERGAQLFRACAACHSLEPGEHRTGPSLAGIFGRESGTSAGFTRYSPALREANIVWTSETLDAWLADPEAMIPGNWMTFQGIDDEQARADLIAYLEPATVGGGSAVGSHHPSPAMPDLETLSPEQQVAAIRYCGDTYHVTTAGGATFPIWEFNLRFKTDSSDRGPRRGRPALLPASMMGDRAFVVFADPGEISGFVERRC